MQRTWANGTRRIVSCILGVLIILLLIAIDQVSKYYFKDLYLEKGTTVVIRNFFSLTYTMNTGAAWSFLAGVSWAQTFFKVLTIISLILFMMFYVYALKKNYKWLQFSLVLIIAGTIGNFIDRIIMGGVIDFLSFTFWGWSFPVFNFADCCLSVGVVMLIIHYLFLDKDAVFKIKKNSDSHSNNNQEESEENANGEV